MSKPRHSGWLKFVEPLDEITPSALAGPGVSRPTATTAPGGSPVCASTASNAWRSASRVAAGPLQHPARGLAQVVDEEPAEAVEHGRVGRGAADVEADDHTRDD